MFSYTGIWNSDFDFIIIKYGAHFEINMQSCREPKMKSTVDVRALIKIFWLPLLVVFIIGQLEIVFTFLIVIPIPSDIFLRVADVLLILIIAVSVYYAVKKKGISLAQVLLLGFLFFVAFGIMVSFVRWILLGHAIYMMTRSLALSFLYSFIAASAGAFGAALDKKMEKK